MRQQEDTYKGSRMEQEGEVECRIGVYLEMNKRGIGAVRRFCVV